MRPPHLLRFVILFLISACGSVSSNESEPAAKDVPRTWTGKVSILVVEGRPPVTGLTTSGDQAAKYVLFSDAATEVVGITRDKVSILWQVGKTYQVRGDVVTDPGEIGTAKGLGFDGIIMVRHVQLLE